jgi:outer membrane immunogenic protein
MKTFALGALAIALAAPSALAADMPVKAVAKAPIVDPWSGVYIGLNVGYSWGRSTTTETVTDITNPGGLGLRFTGGQAFNMNGAIGGGQIGVNWLAGGFLFGLEADLQASGQKGSSLFTCGTLICNPFADTPDTNVSTGTLNQRLTWFGTARARGGVLFAPSVLAYLTGGFAFGGVKSEGTFSGFTPFPSVLVSTPFSISTSRSGWTVGAGLEARLSGNWSAKIEYLYIDLGSLAFSVTNVPVASRLDYRSRITDNIARVGFNYRFGDNAVVARY